jgi:hypothetical protein
MPPTVPINHYSSPRNQQNRTKVLFHYSMLMYPSQNACFEHSNFFKVKVPTPTPRGKLSSSKRTRASVHRLRRRWPESRNPTTSFLTATTLIYAIGAGITAAAGTRLALQLILVKRFKLYSFQFPNSKSSGLLFIVTTSLCQDWVICAPAAFLGCGRHFSGALSGIEP